MKNRKEKKVVSEWPSSKAAMPRNIKLVSTLLAWLSELSAASQVTIKLLKESLPVQRLTTYLFGFQESDQMGARVAWGRSIFTFSSPACTHKSHNTRVTLSLKTIMSTLLLAHTDVTTHEWHCLSKSSLYFCLHTQTSDKWQYLSKKTSLLLFCLHTQMWHEWCSL